jgi:protein tyrosine/serine phosphatase
MKRATAAWREALVARTPDGIRRRLGPAASHLHMLVFDHLLVRTLFSNRHPIAAGAWRAAQPLPHQLRNLRREGLKTVVNLRGKTKTSTYGLERTTCTKEGLRLIDFPMKSRAAPTREIIRAARDLILSVEKPVLFHCKSGADRAGLMSALYLHFAEGLDIAEAKEQLSLRFGHIRQADTGILDEFLDRYLSDRASRPMPFMEWVETVYDPEELQRSFRSKGWANRIVEGVLRRE